MAWEWTEDELVLACALVRANGWRGLRATDPRVKELSALLHRSTIHPLEGRPDTFRSPNSVQRKTWDLATHHPSYTGKPTRGNHLDAKVLDRFLTDAELMGLHVSSVRKRLGSPTPSDHMAPDATDTMPGASTRNVWTAEEMILAADVADDLSWGPVNGTKPEVIALSKLLRSAEIHPGASADTRFRSPSSVGMKINNLRAAHPSHSGKGLRSSRAEEPIVRDFVADRDVMKDAAAEIRRRIAANGATDEDLPTPDEDLIGAAAEGGARAVRVLRRERDPKLRRAKLAQVRAKGTAISCEVCDFDFGTRYGPRGNGYIEVHHRLPLHVSGPVQTTLDDLALLCANCHRMVHAGRWISVEDLQGIHRSAEAVCP